MPKLSAKDLKRLQDLWARIIDPASASEETATARTKLNELLKKNGLTRHDLPKIMAKIEMQRPGSGGDDQGCAKRTCRPQTPA